MNKIFMLIFAFLALVSVKAFAEPCPIDFDGDWDADGIPDSEDACCYVASEGNTTPDEICPDMGTSAADEDLNGNGTAAAAEGKCCVTTPEQCVKLEAGQTCEAAGISVGYEVPCDRLLVYDDDSNGEPYDFCAVSPCVCFTIEDYDRDGVDSSVDNCPTVYNPKQIDSDGDGWGDACDPCKEIGGFEHPLESCELGICSPENCVVVYNPSPADPANARDFLQERCAISPDLDEDHDGVGDYCGDNCAPYTDFAGIDTSNPEQLDADGDGFGDVCDPCPQDGEITELVNSNYEDMDRDGSDDNVCDNCVGTANVDQLNSDDDPWGDACDTCPSLTTAEPVPDDDGDGAGNACDRCPDDSAKVTLGACGCGVSDKDKDEDGTPDCNDVCPTIPFEDSSLDADEDDVPDACDNCPNLYNPEQKNEDSDLFGDACGSIEYSGAFTCHATASHKDHTRSLVTTLLSLF